MMKVILKEDVQHLGVVGDLVSVRDGYGRNFLIPKGKAILASSRSARELEHQKRLAQHHRAQATEQARSDKDKIEALSIAIQAKTAPPPLGEDHEPVAELLPKLFGSVTNRDLAHVLAEAGFKVDRHRIAIPEKVHTVGKFTASVRLDGGVVATLPFWVVPEGTEDVETEKKKVEEAQAAVARKAAEEAAARAKPIEPAPQPEAEAEAEESDEYEEED